MMKWSLVLLAVLSFSAAAGAQEIDSNEPYEFVLAKLLANEGKYDEALGHLDKVLQKDPTNSVLQYEHAMLLLEAGRVEKAESELRAVVAKTPDFYDANRVLGRLLLDRAGTSRAAVEEALKYLEAAFKAYPDDLSTGIAVSQLLTSLNRTNDAERILAQMVERAPDQRALNYSYAQVLTKLGRGAEARQYLERAVQIDPTFTPAIMQLLEIYQQANEFQKAADLLQPLVEDDPLNVEMQRQQAFFYLRAGNARAARDRFKALVAADPKDTRVLYYYAESLNDLEEYAEAEKIFKQLIAAEPKDPDFVASYALSLAGQKKWDEASTRFNQLLTMSDVPENLNALARTQLSFIDLQKGNYAAAAETAKSILVFRNKPNAQAINIAVEALRKQEKNADVVALLEPLVTKYPDDPFLNARYVESLIRSGDKTRAKQIADTQIKLGSRNAIAAAEAYASAKDLKSAIDLMKSAVAAKPEDLDLRFQLGSIYERANDFNLAEQSFLSVLEKNPQHAPTLNYLGYMYAERNVNLDKAHEMLTRAVGQEPQNGAYVDSLGWVYFRLGNLDLAEKYLTDAVRLMPRDATVHEHLGDVLAKRGDMARALQVYKTAIGLDPEQDELEKLRTKIAEIERSGQTSQR
ncbi:MAG TPA: tetratricopeptide repeat protein [Thermoanaerobaculia bacterium]|nr:tetratricopeptide repeat protein [Thermoanaerobaculia bacterium]